MRVIPFVFAAFALLVSGPSFAQGWIEYASQEDLFTANFPSEPTVRDITYATEYGVTLPARVHSAEGGQNRYSVTVVQYGDIQEIHAKRLEGCTAYPNLCNNPWDRELRGALDYAAWGFIQRDAKVTHYAHYRSDFVEGRQVQLTNADQSRTFAAIHMHENRLYILEGTVPPGAPQPAMFQQSLGFIDTDGFRVRYESVYANMYPPPPRVEYGQSAGQPGR